MVKCIIRLPSAVCRYRLTMLSALCCGLGSLLGSLGRSPSNLHTNEYRPLNAEGQAGISESLPFPVQCTQGPQTDVLYFPTLRGRETGLGETTTGPSTGLNGSRGSRCVLGRRHNKEMDKCPICEIDGERLLSGRRDYGDVTAPQGPIQSTAARKNHSGRDLCKVMVNVEVIPVCEEE